jgi:hypothetical protein
VSEQWDQPTQGQPEPGQEQPSFPQYPQQQFPAAPPLGGGYGGYPGGGYGPAPTNGLALATLILGIVSIVTLLFGFGPVIGLVAVILGPFALRRARRTGGLRRGMAWIGTILGLISLVVGIVVIGAAVKGAVDCKNEGITSKDTGYSTCVRHHMF